MRELPGVLRQRYEHRLRHVLGQVRIANHAHRGGMDQVNMPPHEFGKRRLRPASGVIAQKLLVCQTVHSQNSNRCRSNRTGKGMSHSDDEQFSRDLAAEGPC